jgi:hypothetical protein
MALSPNYGWAEPDNSSLVKNGAQDIRALGDAIDTSVWNVGYGQAGKNKIINGNFGVNQRNFTSATTTGNVGFDMWPLNATDGTTTYSTQAFTAGAAPVAGYEGTNYARLVTSGQTLTSANSNISSRIEDVRTFAGQTVTLSFWAQAGSGTPKIALELAQSFGSTGSPSALVTTYAGQVTLSTSWARYSVTVAVPSISGKTITNNSYLAPRFFVSAGSDLNSRTGSLGIQTNTFNIWGCQLEYGSKMTPFQLAGGGSPQAELAMCQRYYWRVTPGSNAYGRLLGGGGVTSTTRADFGVRLPVTMRIGPTAIDVPSTITWIRLNGTAAYTISAITLDTPTNPNTANIYVASTLMVAGQAINLDADNNTGAFIGFSAEL